MTIDLDVWARVLSLVPFDVLWAAEMGVVGLNPAASGCRNIKRCGILTYMLRR